MADSYRIKIKGRDIAVTLNDMCFSHFNSTCAQHKGDLEEASIIIEKNKVEQHTQEFVLKFLNNCLNAGVIPFEIVEEEDKYILNLNVREVKNKTHLQYTGMVIRCLYEPKKSDEFQIIAKHFVNLCDYFPEEDRGKLFTISCNLYLFNDGKGKGEYGFNSNHILMYRTGCKVITTKEIISLLDKNKGINTEFSCDVDKNKYKLKTSLFKLTKIGEGKAYEKVL